MDEKENSMVNYKGLKKTLSNLNGLINKNKIKINDTLTMSEDGILGISVPVKPITTAEYEKLGKDEKESDTIYAIIDDTTTSSNSGGSSEVYSTKESRIGTWIDGKPLYRKAGRFTILAQHASEYNDTLIQIENVENVISLHSTLHVLHSNSSRPLPYSLDSACCYLSYFYSSSSLKYFNTTSSFINCPIDFVIEYTKTTDAEMVQSPDINLGQESRPDVEPPSFNSTATSSGFFDSTAASSSVI